MISRKFPINSPSKKGNIYIMTIPFIFARLLEYILMILVSGVADWRRWDSETKWATTQAWGCKMTAHVVVVSSNLPLVRSILLRHIHAVCFKQQMVLWRVWLDNHMFFISNLDLLKKAHHDTHVSWSVLHCGKQLHPQFQAPLPKRWVQKYWNFGYCI